MKSKGGQWSHETAVSETVGFIIIFGIMLTGIGLVTLYGYPALLDAQANADIRNMERNMISIQSDVKSLAYKSVPFKESTLQISGGSLTIENPSDHKEFRILYSNGSEIGKFQPGSLLFTSASDDTLISLQNGAVVKRQSGGSVMLSEPRWFYDEDQKTLLLTFINIDTSPPGQRIGKSGIGTIQMAIEENAPIDLPFPGGDDVVIEYTDIEGDYRTAWKNYFENRQNMNAIPPKKWQKTNVERLIIKSWNVTVLNI